MLILLILLLASCIFIVLWFINRHKLDTSLLILPGLMCMFGFAFALVFSIGINTKEEAYRVQTQTQSKINDLARERRTLLYSSDKEAVSDYNKRADTLRNDILEKQKSLENPCINTFVCYGYKDIDVSEIKNITFTITFEQPK